MAKQQFNKFSSNSLNNVLENKLKNYQKTKWNGRWTNGNDSQEKAGFSKKSKKFNETRDDIVKQKLSLPITAVKSKVIKALKSNDTILFIGETACGKTTQIPQYILEAGCNDGKMIAVTQPRRVAAISISIRVAKEMSTTLGQKVGYSVRFDENTSSETKIKFMTDGMLLREAITDPLLTRYSVLVLDEVHERSIQTDVLFGVVKRSIALRSARNLPKIKVVLMSATMDVDLFSKYFDNSPVFYLQGRQYPIEKQYLVAEDDDYVQCALVTTLQIHKNEDEGDILVFCTGQEEIQSMVSAIKSANAHPPPQVAKLFPVPLFANLPTHEQMRIFEPLKPSFSRKVIFTTNIAETSITIPGVRYVVDSMRVKARNFNVTTGFESLKVELISKSQAEQRAGRAGREGPGKCYRLVTEEQFLKLNEFSTPEILRVELSGVLLNLVAMGVKKIETFEFLSQPSKDNIQDSIKKLLTLGAIQQDPDGHSLTSLGKEMVLYPLDPKYSKMLIASVDHNCSEEIISIISCLYVENLFHILPEMREKANEVTKKFISSEGDHIRLLNIIRSYQAAKMDSKWCYENFINSKNMATVCEVRKQLLRLFDSNGKKKSSCGSKTEKVRKCLLEGLKDNVAVLQREGYYQTVESKEKVYIHPSSCLFGCKPEAVIYSELVDTTKHFMRNLSLIDLTWLKSPPCE